MRDENRQEGERFNEGFNGAVARKKSRNQGEDNWSEVKSRGTSHGNAKNIFYLPRAYR